MRRLLPPKNLRPKAPACCATCTYGHYERGAFVCERPDGPTWDADDDEEWFHICDRFKKRGRRLSGQFFSFDAD